MLVFAMGIIMVNLILAAQYERWSLPFAVVLAVPFALFGASARCSAGGCPTTSTSRSPSSP
jgi:multidrug efflux pump subunit AcrB